MYTNNCSLREKRGVPAMASCTTPGNIFASSTWSLMFCSTHQIKPCAVALVVLIQVRITCRILLMSVVQGRMN